MKDGNSGNFSEEFLENLLLGNRHQCSEIAKKYLAQSHTYPELYEDVIRVSLYEVGRLWEINKISVATEHLATAISEGILNELFSQIVSNKRINRKVVVACVENEMHQVGAKMVADTFEMQGWDSYFLGTGIPAAELVRYIHETNPDLIAISLSIYLHFTNFLKLLEKFSVEFPDLQIIAGGQAFRHMTPEITARVGNILLFPDLYLLEKYIQFLNSKNQ